MSIAIIFGSTTGNTESAAMMIKDELGAHVSLFEDVADIQPQDLLAHDVLLFGCPTWHIGELQDDWERFVPEMNGLDLSGKKIAFFGMGDALVYDTFGCIWKDVEPHQNPWQSTTCRSLVDRRLWFQVFKRSSTNLIFLDWAWMKRINKSFMRREYKLVQQVKNLACNPNHQYHRIAKIISVEATPFNIEFSRWKRWSVAIFGMKSGLMLLTYHPYHRYAHDAFFSVSIWSRSFIIQKPISTRVITKITHIYPQTIQSHLPLDLAPPKELHSLQIRSDFTREVGESRTCHRSDISRQKNRMLHAPIHVSSSRKFFFSAVTILQTEIGSDVHENLCAKPNEIQYSVQMRAEITILPGFREPPVQRYDHGPPNWAEQTHREAIDPKPHLYSSPEVVEMEWSAPKYTYTPMLPRESFPSKPIAISKICVDIPRKPRSKSKQRSTNKQKPCKYWTAFLSL